VANRDLKIMDFLKRHAIDNHNFRHAKLASAVVIKGRIISLGINQRKSHPFQKTYAKNSQAIFLHAEINAIKNSLNHLSPNDLRQATLYVYRVKRPYDKATHWTNGNARPCKGCMGAISEFNFKRIVYTTDTTDEFAVQYT